MKLLHIFPSFAIGGQQRRLALLANALPGLCHDIAALDGDYASASLFSDQVRWEKRGLDLKKTSLLSLANMAAIRDCCTESQPDLLCTYNWGAIEVSAVQKFFFRAGEKLAHIHFEDGFGPDERIDRQKWQRCLVRSLLLKSAHVVVPSSGLKRSAVKDWRLRPNQVELIPNGVDLEVFAPRDHLREKRISIGCVGALRAEKNIQRLLRTFAKLSDKHAVELIIVGEGPERAELEASATALGVAERVRFMGQLANTASLYQQMDILALTSDTEQMPFSVLEAMASGLPVLATNVGDVKMMLDDTNHGFIFEPHDEQGLVGGLEKLITDSALAKKIGMANLQKVRTDYSLEKMISNFQDLFNRVAPKTR